MKYYAVLFAVCATKAAGSSTSPLERELAFAEQAINRQLTQDHAPEKLSLEEAALLGQVGKAIGGTEAKIPRKQGSMFLAHNHQGQSRAQAAQALAAKVSREIKFVEKATEVQLAQDHAPSALVQQEEGLLKQAAAVAQKAQRMVGKSIATETKERSIEKQLRTEMASMAASKATMSTNAGLQQFATQELILESREKSRLNQTESARVEAIKALKDVHANATTQQKVADLLAKVALEEKNEIASTKQSEDATRHLEEALTKHKIEVRHVQSSSAKLEMKAAKAAETDGAQAKLRILEAKNAKLLSENIQLKHEHDVLQHEERLVEDNTALAQDNKNLRAENAVLKQKLANAA